MRDGLAHSRVVAIQEDRKGYLWFGTWEGLSRFDGYGFTNYGTGDGLGNALINAIAEDRQGGLWIATNGGGVSRLLDGPAEFVARPHEPGSPRSKFESFPVADSPESNRVNALLFDSADNCWCATDDGLYSAAHKESGKLRFELVVPHQPVADFMAAFADSKGRLWFGIVDRVVEIVEGQITTYPSPEGVGQATITSIAQGANGEVLLANPRRVFEFVEPAQTVSRGLWRRTPVALKPNQIVHQILLDREKTLWLATQEGLIKYKESQTLYTTANGLSDNITVSLATDRYGALWIGTWSGGVCKLRGEMIVSFTGSEGLSDQHVLKVIEDQRGHIYAGTGEGGVVEIVGGRVVPVPGSQEPPFSGDTTCFVQDRRGDWWIGTKHGLFLFKGPELQLRHGKKLTAADGLQGGIVEELYEDPAGRMWISAGDRRLYYAASDGTQRAHFKAVSLEAVQPPGPVTWMAGDMSGGLWIGGRFGLMARLKNGTVKLFRPGDGLPETDTRALFLDSRGWLWIGLRSKGVSMTKNPSADLPNFVNYSTDNGLASAYVLSITEDESGRMYLGTFKGLDRLDPLTGEIRHFSATDGLVGDVISHCMRDSRGNIWVATSTGLSMLNPRAEPAVQPPPPIYLSRVEVAGEDLRLPETGNLRMSAAELAASRNNLLIEFVGLDFQDEQEVRYRYKLEGADADWSKPTFQRSVNYGRLGPGSYRFRVKAIDRSGTESLEPAMLEFRILPPIWQRWWFISAATLLVSCMVYAMHRNRLRRLLDLERVRTRIASDLHDDIGSNLSLIAGMSEMLGQQAHQIDPQMAERLSLIGSVSRRSVDAMSDIVWAVNPKRDNLLDLAHRMRRFASDSFTPRNITFDFDAPNQRIRIATDVRREVFLVFKEAINNIVRHAGCGRAEVALELSNGQVILRVSDDGPGFDQSGVEPGQGLESMRRRAGKLGGEFLVISAAGAGTTVILKAPLGRRD